VTKHLYDPLIRGGCQAGGRQASQTDWDLPWSHTFT